MVIDPQFKFGEIVWHLAAVGNEDCLMKGIVTGYEVWPDTIRYDVRWADNTTGTYHGFELTNEEPNPFEQTAELN